MPKAGYGKVVKRDLPFTAETFKNVALGDIYNEMAQVMDIAHISGDKKENVELMDAIEFGVLTKIHNTVNDKTGRNLLGALIANGATDAEASLFKSKNISARPQEIGMFLEENLFGNKRNSDPSADVSFDSLIESIEKTYSKIADGRKVQIEKYISSLKKEKAEFDSVFKGYIEKRKEKGLDIMRAGGDIKASMSKTKVLAGTWTKNLAIAPEDMGNGAPDQIYVGPIALTMDDIIYALNKIYEKMNTLILLSVIWRYSSSGSFKENMILKAIDIFNDLRFDKVVKALFENDFVKIVVNSNKELKMNPQLGPVIKLRYGVEFKFAENSFDKRVKDYINENDLYVNKRQIYPRKMTAGGYREFFWALAGYIGDRDRIRVTGSSN